MEELAEGEVAGARIGCAGCVEQSPGLLEVVVLEWEGVLVGEGSREDGRKEAYEIFHVVCHGIVDFEVGSA